MSEAVYEIVHAVFDYSDGPRGGVADFRGQPHFFECVFDEAEDEWTPVYRLKPLDEETFRLTLEAWGIWSRWSEAFVKGETDLATHPALPADRRRHDEISEVLKPRLAVMDAAAAFEARGEFKVGEPKRTGEPAPLLVRWQLAP
jgi:hypothetical protein